MIGFVRFLVEMVARNEWGYFCSLPALERPFASLTRPVVPVRDWSRPVDTVVKGSMTVGLQTHQLTRYKIFIGATWSTSLCLRQILCFNINKHGMFLKTAVHDCGVTAKENISDVSLTVISVQSAIYANKVSLIVISVPNVIYANNATKWKLIYAI